MMAVYEKCKGENRKGEPCRLLFHERERRHRFTGEHVLPRWDGKVVHGTVVEATPETTIAPLEPGCVEDCGAPARLTDLFTTCAAPHGVGQGTRQCPMCPHIVGCPGPKVAA